MILDLSSFGETEYFLCSLLLGVFLGAVYDVFRLVRIVLPKNNALIFVEDVLFCMFSTVSFLLLAFNVGSGRIRGFAAAGTLFGFSLYYSTVGKLVYKANEKIISFLKRSVKRAISFFAAPICRLIGKLKKASETKKLERKRKRLVKKALTSAKKGFGLEEKR